MEGLDIVTLTAACLGAVLSLAAWRSKGRTVRGVRCGAAAAEAPAAAGELAAQAPKLAAATPGEVSVLPEGQADGRSTDARASGERRVRMIERLETFEHVTDSAGIGMFSWDMVADRTSWSAHHYAIFAYPEGIEVTHPMFWDRIHPEDRAAVRAVMDAAVAEGRDYVQEFRICLPDGAVRHVRGSGRAAYGPDGAALRMYGAVIDITETAEALKARTEREWELATVAANLPDLISRFDRQRRRIFVSPRIEQLTGQPPSFFLGKTHEQLDMDSVLAARWRAVLEDVIESGRVREFDYQYFDHAGRERFFITRAIPAFDGDGAVESVLTIATDHTERERVTRQLRDDGKILEKADLRKNEYLATLAHELRGPLAPISSAVQLMKLTDKAETWQRAREVIERQVGQLAALVDDLMEIGRISSGKMVIERALLELDGVLAHALENVRPLFDAKQQQLRVDLLDSTAWLEGDAVRLTQVFSNLLTNASKYTAAHGNIALSARRDGEQLVVEVSDDGAGLTESSMIDIFDMFVQVHHTGTQSQGGLGIGLSLVRQLVRLHGGEVVVASEGLGKGACFTVRLPLAQPPASEPAPAPATGSEPAPASATGSAPATAPANAPAQDESAASSASYQQFRLPADQAQPPAAAAKALRILVVDDNIDGAQTLASLLGALGHHTQTAHTGREALRLVGEGALDLVFLDLGLPDISGIQVALTLRGTAPGRRLRLIALTGLGREQDRFMTRAARFDEHLVKPIQMADVLRLVGRAADGPQIDSV